MKRIYLIRHGQCHGQGTYVGRGTDISINREGREATAALAEQLKAEGISPVRIISSSLKRACESADIVAEKFGYTSPIQKDPRLDEMDFGLWEGLTYKEICRDFPRESQLWVRDSWNVSPPGGESSRQLAQRVTDFYHSLLSSLKEGDTLLTGHGGSLRMLLCMLMGLTPQSQWQFRLDRSGVAGIEFCGDLPVLIRLGTQPPERNDS